MPELTQKLLDDSKRSNASCRAKACCGLIAAAILSGIGGLIAWPVEVIKRQCVFTGSIKDDIGFLSNNAYQDNLWHCGLTAAWQFYVPNSTLKFSSTCVDPITGDQLADLRVPAQKGSTVAINMQATSWFFQPCNATLVVEAGYNPTPAVPAV